MADLSDTAGTPASEAGPGTTHHDRRRRHREAIVAATRAEIERRRWPQVTVEAIAAAAGISRTAFYQHFADKQEVLLSLLDELARGVDDVGSPWLSGGTDPQAELAESLGLIVRMWVRDGRVFRAVFEGGLADSRVEEASRQLFEAIVASAVIAIDRDRANGHTGLADAEAVARALVLLNERYLIDSFGAEPLADPDVVTGVLVHIWTRALF